MTQTNPWAGKVLALIKSGNTAAAIAQIKVAPSIKDLNALHSAIVAAKLTGRWRDVDAAHCRQPRAVSRAALAPFALGGKAALRLIAQCRRSK